MTITRYQRSPGLLGSRGRGIALESRNGRQHRLNWPACPALHSCPRIPGQIKSAVLLRDMMPLYSSCPCLCSPLSPEPLAFFLCSVWKTPCSQLPWQGLQPRKRCGHSDAPSCHMHTGNCSESDPHLTQLVPVDLWFGPAAPCFAPRLCSAC